MVDVAALSWEEEQRRQEEIYIALLMVEDATCSFVSKQQRDHALQWLCSTPFTIRQIKAAADIVATMPVFGKPLAREHWHKAFNEAIVHPRQVRELCEKAFQKGYEAAQRAFEERDDQEEATERMDAVTARLLEAEKEIMTLRQERERQARYINDLERELRHFLSEEEHKNESEPELPSEGV